MGSRKTLKELMDCFNTIRRTDEAVIFAEIAAKTEGQSPSFVCFVKGYQQGMKDALEEMISRVDAKTKESEEQAQKEAQEIIARIDAEVPDGSTPTLVDTSKEGTCSQPQ